jgi:hypothetical protein
MVNVLKSSTSTGFNLAKWVWKNKFIILVVFAYIPILVTSIHVAQANNYPVGQYIVIQSGISLVNADSTLGNYVYSLKTNPVEVIGMVKPDHNIFLKISYFFHVFRVVWAILGMISLVTLPFFAFFFLFNQGNNSTKARSFWRALLVYAIWVVFINLILVVVGVNQIPFESDSFFPKTFHAIKMVLPFHGVYDLIKYLIGLVV